ncbi:hypothetical protein C8R42DRAFT_757290 [Lentinula raphanica]|nr:hypothetical protein C8R42DRAFT_757290 [Lentinula raphanica]
MYETFVWSRTLNVRRSYGNDVCTRRRYACALERHSYGDDVGRLRKEGNGNVPESLRKCMEDEVEGRKRWKGGRGGREEEVEGWMKRIKTLPYDGTTTMSQDGWESMEQVRRRRKSKWILYEGCLASVLRKRVSGVVAGRRYRLLLTPDQEIFIVQLLTQHSHLLPPRLRLIPSQLNLTENPGPGSNAGSSEAPAEESLAERIRDLERREREVARREQALERWQALGIGHSAASLSGEGFSEAQEGLVSSSTLSGEGGAEELCDNLTSLPGLLAHNLKHSAASSSGREENGDAADAAPDEVLSSLHSDCPEQEGSQDDGQTLVDSDFTDKWFQDQAEVFSPSVEDWLADQVEEQFCYSSQSNSRKRTCSDGDLNDSSTSNSTGNTEEDNVERGTGNGGSQTVEENEGGGGGGRGGGADPGRPAHACARNGRSARASKRRKTAHHALQEDVQEEEEEEEELEEEEENSPGEDFEAAHSGWQVSSTPAPSSKEVRNSATLLLLEIAMGEGMWIESSCCDVWIDKLHNTVKGKQWDEEVSVESGNLTNLARLLRRSEAAEVGVTFVRMMMELMFAAKINSILHHQRLLLNEAGKVEKASLRPVLGRLMKEQNIALNTLLAWYSAGSRWGRLAAGGTVYLLMIIASKPGLAAKLKGRRVTSTAIVDLTNLLRFPTNTFRNYFSIRKTLDCRDLAGNDNYFERFFQRTATPLPRLSSFWQALLNASSGTGSSLFSLHYMTRSYLSSSFEDSDSEDERLQVSTQSSSLPIFVQNYDSRQGVDVLYSTFSYAKAAEGKKAPFPKGNRQSWTEKYRQQAEKGIIIDNLEDLAIGMRERFYDDHEVTGTPGTFKNSQKWLRVSNTLINSREICLLDSNAKLICYSNGTLSSLERGRLLTALMLFFNTEPGGVKLISRNASGRTHNMFTTFHFSTWGRYGQNKGLGAPPEVHPFFLRRTKGSKTNTSQFFMRSSKDLQVFADLYDLLCEVLGEVLQKIVSRALTLFPKELKDVEANVDIFPLNDNSPVKPFTSFVLNVNVETVAHRDNGDNSLCIVLDLGNHSGGGLCLFEPKIVLELTHGDWVIFPSKSYTHFNLRYSGMRCSAVIHSDKDGISYQKDGNGWDGNQYVLKPSVAVARSTRSSTTKSSKSPATTAASSAKPSTKAQRSVKSSATTSASKVSPTPPASGLIGPRAAEYLKAQLAEEKRKKVIREKAKAAKASEKEDFSDEEANDRASSPPVTSDVEDVEVDEDEEEFNNVYGEEHTPEEQPLEHLEDGQEEEDHALEGFQDMEVDVDTPDNGIDLVKTPTKASTPFSSPSKCVSVQAAVARTKLRHQLNVSPSRTYSRPSPDKRKVYKVTSNMFSPRTRKLAVAGKRHARRVLL